MGVCILVFSFVFLVYFCFYSVWYGSSKSWLRGNLIFCYVSFLVCGLCLFMVVLFRSVSNVVSIFICVRGSVR